MATENPAQGKAEAKWIDTVLKRGTIADRLAAHTLLVHESKDWNSLDTLIEMVDPRKCRRQCMMAMATLKELFVDSLNPYRKGSQLKTEEDKKKVRFYYTKFIDHLNMVAFDNLEETRKKAIWTLFELLTKYNDNKEYILEKLINKMGDKVPKIATTAGHLVEKAANNHRDELRLRTIKFVQKFLMRPNHSSRTRYYSVALLSRIKLVRGNYDIANDLVECYLTLFTSLTKDKKVDTKLMNSILVGIHRAYPYTKIKGGDIFEQHLQTLYTLVHQVNFRMRTVAMILIKKIVAKRAESLKCPIEDRFYNLVFGQLMEPELLYCSRTQVFANFLLEVINEDTVLERKEAFVKRMLQVALNSKPELAQLLLSTISKIKGINTDLCVYSKEDINNDNNDEDDDNSAEEEEEEEKDEDEEDVDSNENNSSVEESKRPPVGSSWVHIKKRTSKSCDLLARNPRAAKPEHLNELHLLRRCFDPTIAGVAQKLIRN